jgi:type IV pilus assembly protein PilM
MLTTKKHGWVGFDLGAASVKVAQLVRKDGGYRISSAAIVSRSEAWQAAKLAEDRPLSSADELGAAASLCEHLTGSAAAALFPAAMCDGVAIDAPAAKRGAATDWLRAVEAETQRPMRERLYTTWPTAVQPGKLNVVTAPRVWSEQISSDVLKSRWNCQLIDCLPWALARAASIAKPQNQDRLLGVLDWGYGKATMCLVNQGAPALVRTLRDCAFQSALDRVAQTLRLDGRDAAILLRKHGLGVQQSGAEGGSASVIEEVLREPLSRLVQEIRRTIGYWQGLLRGKTPETIYLFGGGGTVDGVDHYLSQSLQLAVESWRLPVEASVDRETLPPLCLLGAAAGLSAAAWEAP